MKLIKNKCNKVTNYKKYKFAPGNINEKSNRPKIYCLFFWEREKN